LEIHGTSSEASASHVAVNPESGSSSAWSFNQGSATAGAFSEQLPRLAGIKPGNA
jgi:hypothetical protein